ncbi:MAG: tetratricopeptide repeat protein [Nitrospinota bacterium]
MMSILKKYGFIHGLLILVVLGGTSCTSIKNTFNWTKDSIVSNVKKTYRGTQNSIVSIAGKTAITRNDLDQDFLFAQHQFNRREFSASEFYLKKTLANRPGDLRALNLLPWTYFFQKRFDKALIAFGHAHTFNRKNPVPIIGMGWCYFSLKHYERALESFDHADRLMPNSYEVHKGRAFIYLEQKRHNLAREELSHIFNVRQVENILQMWDEWTKTNPDAVWEIVPSSAASKSIFTLPAEHPRYRSSLWGLPTRKDLVERDAAWKAFHEGKFRKAMKDFEDLALVNNPTLDAVNGLAWSLLKAKQINKSEDVFKEILELHPQFIGAIEGIKEIKEIKKRQAVYVQYYLDLGKYRLAKEKLDELLFRYKNWAHPYNQHGKISLAQKNYDLAKDYFLEALEKEPNNSIAKNGLEQILKAQDKHLFKADQALKHGDFKTAALIYYDYVQEDEDWPSDKFHRAHAYNGLGWSQFQKKQYQYAIDKFSKSIEHDDYKVDASKGLGLSLFAIGEYHEAVPFLETALLHDPGNKELAYKLDWSILQSEPPSEALKYFEKIRREHPLLASPYMALGWVHYKHNNPDLAIEFFLKAISLDPDFALTSDFVELLSKERFGWQVYNSLGWTYFHNGKNDKAMEMFQTSLEIQPNRSDARKGMGYIYFRQGKFEKAKQYLEQCLALNPTPNPVFELITGTNAIAPFKLQSTPHTKLGRIYLSEGNSQRAITHFSAELKQHPDQPDAYDGLGWAYLEQNRDLEARAAFTMAIRLDPLNNSAQKGLRQAKQSIAEKRLGQKSAKSNLPLSTSLN